MSFAGTVGAVGTVQLYTMTDATTVGTLAIEFSLITGRGPKENTTTGGLYDLDLKHALFTEAFLTWYAAASPYDAAGSAAATLDLDTGTTLGGGTSSTAPEYMMVAAITEDPDSDKIVVCMNKVQIEKGSADISTAKGKYNEVTTKLKGITCTGDTVVADTKYPAVVDGVSKTLTKTVPSFYNYLPKAA
jgi:hypothetical protein